MPSKTFSRKSVRGKDAAVQHPYSIKQVARIIGTHPRTVRRAVAAGTIPGITVSPRITVIPRAAFDRIFGLKRAAR